MPHTIKTLVYEKLVVDRETDLAWCFVFERGLPHVYLPKSVVEDIRETSNEVDVPLWMVDAKGLDDYIINRQG